MTAAEVVPLRRDDPPGKPKFAWWNAIWDDEDLKPAARAVAYAYYRFADDTGISWCAWPELMRRTGIKSRDTINRVLSDLENAGWLERVDKARQHHSTRYRLTVPP